MNFDLTKSKWLYIDVPVEVAQNRIIERGRIGEKNISKQYLINLKQEHDNYYSNDNAKIKLSMYQKVDIPKIVKKIDNDIQLCLTNNVENEQTIS